MPDDAKAYPAYGAEVQRALIAEDALSTSAHPILGGRLMMGDVASHESDFFSWTQEQANLLQQRKFDQVDVDHLIEELKLMGARERRELMSRLRVLAMHLLKWKYQPAYRSRSWELTISNQRDELDIHLRENPALRSQLNEILIDSYRLARRDAEKETGIAEVVFPEHCPWTTEQLLNSGYIPD